MLITGIPDNFFAACSAQTSTTLMLSSSLQEFSLINSFNIRSYFPTNSCYLNNLAYRLKIEKKSF